MPSDCVDYGVVVPMANESLTFGEFTSSLLSTFDRLGGGTAYAILDRSSTDGTLSKSYGLSKVDSRFVTIYCPNNRNLVDAYLEGHREALRGGHRYIVEMDAGMSHDPCALPAFLKALADGNDCAFGSRFMEGSSYTEAPLLRKALSKGGTILSNALLGMRMKDMTSGYMAFNARAVRMFAFRKFRSTAHFYQTEVKYLLRNLQWVEIPIHYRDPSPRMSLKSVCNALETLLFYSRSRFKSDVGIHG